MKKKMSGTRLRYQFDQIMSRGTAAMIVLLFCLVMLIVAALSIAACFVGGEGGVAGELWTGFMMTLDAGNLSGIATDNIPYLAMMALATLCGIFLTSILIGLITTGIESKLSDLNKGISVVQEKGHTVIIGFNDHIFGLLTELIEANANHKGACVVILGSQEKAEMEAALNARISDYKTTKVVCRSGVLYEAYALERCAIENSRSVIVNIHEDPDTVRVLLALSAYIKGKKLLHPELRFTTAVREQQYVEAAELAAEGRVSVVYVRDAIARIIANTCRQHGLSQVLTELFNFSGNELYFEKVPALIGKSFGDALSAFPNAVAVGLYGETFVGLNPPMDTVISEGDRLVLLEQDDGAYSLSTPPAVKEELICSKGTGGEKKPDRLIVLGSNDKLPILLAEYDSYVAPGTTVVIVDDDMDPAYIGSYENLEISLCHQPVSRELLCQLLDGSVANVLLLNDDSVTGEQSDAKTLLNLLLLRDIADRTQQHFAITTEMQDIDNQRLATRARVDDFVVGSNFVSLIMAQIAENCMLLPLIDDLLDESGSELYMKPATDYIHPGTAVNGYVLTESAARRGEIFVGYRHMSPHPAEVVVNPDKRKEIVFGENDLIVVVAQN